MNNQNKFSVLFGMIFGIIGGVFLVLGLILLYTGFGSAGAVASDFMVVGAVFSIIGGSFLAVGLCFLLFAHMQKAKRAALMSGGVCYEGEIVRIYDNLFMNINYRHPFVVECVYKDASGRACLVKSGNIWPSHYMIRENDIKARVWVDSGNPKNYYVEVYSGSDKNFANVKYDYDYR